MRRRCDFQTEDAGFTLVEMIVVMSTLLVVLSAAFFVLNSVQRMTNTVSAREQASTAADAAVGRIARELRQAQPLSSAPNDGALQACVANGVTLYADLTGDGIPEKVSYYVSGTTLFRQQAAATNSNPTPGDFGAYGPAQAVLSGLDPASVATGLFTYYDSQDPPTPVGPSHPEDVTAISIAVGAIGKSGDVEAIASSKTLVMIRSMAPAIN